MTHGHRQQCGDGQREGVGAGLRRAKKEGMGTSVILLTIKIKFKKFNVTTNKIR